MHKSTRHPAGIVELDAILGMAIVGILLLVVGRSVLSQREVDQRMADHRAAVALAEQTLASLQLDAALPTPTPHSRAQVKSLEDKFHGDFIWVQVTAHFRATSATITGIARRSAAEKAAREALP